MKAMTCVCVCSMLPLLVKDQLLVPFMAASAAFYLLSSLLYSPEGAPLTTPQHRPTFSAAPRHKKPDDGKVLLKAATPVYFLVSVCGVFVAESVDLLH